MISSAGRTQNGRRRRAADRGRATRARRGADRGARRRRSPSRPIVRSRPRYRRCRTSQVETRRRDPSRGPRGRSWRCGRWAWTRSRGVHRTSGIRAIGSQCQQWCRRASVPPRLEGSRHDPTPRASFEALPPYECSEFDRGQLSLEEPDEVLPRQNFFLANRVQVTNALLPEHEPVVALHDFSFISRPRPLNHRRERIPRTRLERCFGATCDGSLRTQRRSRPSGKVLGSRLLHRMPTALAGC